MSHLTEENRKTIASGIAHKRHIDERKVNFTKMDLPYAVTYKKRKQ